MSEFETNLEERDDELNKQMATHPAEESIQVLVKDAHRSKRYFRILAISVALDIILSIGLAFFAYQTNQAVRVAQSSRAAIVANCETANDSRNKQLVLWGYVLSLTPQQPRTPEQEARVDEFKEFVEKTFAPRDCQAEINK